MSYDDVKTQYLSEIKDLLETQNELLAEANEQRKKAYWQRNEKESLDKLRHQQLVKIFSRMYKMKWGASYGMNSYHDADWVEDKLKKND